MENIYAQYGLIGLAILITLFFIFRELVLWYWKVKVIINNQNRTNELLEKQNELLEENTNTLRQFVDDFTNK